MNNRRLARLGVSLGALAVLIAFLVVTPYRWEPARVWRFRLLFLEGLKGTLILSLGGLIVGLVLGLLSGLGRLSRNVVANQLSTLYVEFVRGYGLTGEY